jgi:hypothetical protein
MDVVSYLNTHIGWMIQDHYNMEDEYELEQDLAYKGKISLQDYANNQYNDIYKRNHKLYLESIEWDTWCTKDSQETIQEQVKQKEIETHPFNQFF